MNKLLTNMLTVALLSTAVGAYAATDANTNKDDASNLGTSDTPQKKQQDRRIDKKSMSKSNSSTHDSKTMMESNKKMDTNSDGMISKQEYMTHQEMMFGTMKQTNGGVSLEDMHSGMTESAITGGLEGKTVGGADRASTGNKY